MTPAPRLACCCAALALAGGCATPMRLLEAPQAEAPAAAMILAADIHIWERFGRQSLPLRRASLTASALARAKLAARLPAACNAGPVATDPPLDEVLALYQRVATAWLADPSAGRAGLSVGGGLAKFAGNCPTALILLGQQLPQPGPASSWLSLGALAVADGQLLRLAALPLAPEDDLRRPEVLQRRIGQLLERLYR